MIKNKVWHRKKLLEQSSRNKMHEKNKNKTYWTARRAEKLMKIKKEKREKNNKNNDETTKEEQ